ncbi:MAG: two-component sensor histidine kinase, partial [Calditrichaeota bacterium]|nr:two-component sensor histidine kinase [Calditrichota bacterium]
YLQTIQKKPDMDLEKKTLFLDNGLSELNRLNELIENILYTVKLEAEPKVMASMPQPLTETIDRIIKNNETIHRISIKRNLEPNIYHHISTEAIELVLNNLISNAVKYSQEKAQITVVLKLNGSTIQLTVSDKGSGIPDHEKELIFNRFYRIGNEENRDTKGTGIGLYIVRQIIRLAKGTVVCENNQPNGSLFIIKLENGMTREN